MPPSHFPLRWESTGDQWWYATPIDFAAANGHYDLVRELLYIDTNLLIKLTSLRRIRRLETVWDDEEQFNDVAKCRSHVARELLRECETKRGHNTLIRAGYGGWLLYTAASAGDGSFVRELLERDPLLVFGEGEYGVTDIFYAAARSRNSEVFRLLLDFSISPPCGLGSGGELEGQHSESHSEFNREMMNRAVHAAARGGNLEILKELLGDCSDVLAYRDAQGSTVLHAAAGRGQLEVVKDLITSFDIIASRDHQGNTALHVAAYRGYLAAAEVLILASPSLATLTNNYGDTFLHMAVSGFRTSGFRRVDRQIELIKLLVSGKIVSIKDVINVKNNDGRTALHLAVIENIQSDLVELLMTVPSISLNIRDANAMTPLDLLKQRPRSASSQILIKQLISAGGISNCQDNITRSAIVSHLKGHGIGMSPGTSFRIPDAEIFLYAGIENAFDASCDETSVGDNSCFSDPSDMNMGNSLDNIKPGSVNNTARRLRSLLQLPRRQEKKTAFMELQDDDPFNSYNLCQTLEDRPIPLRQRYSKLFPCSTNRRTFSGRSSLPSPLTRKKFTIGLMHGVIQAKQHYPVSPSSPFPRSSLSSPISLDKEKDIDIAETSYSNQPSKHKQASFNKKLMNQYFCFGAQGLIVEDSGTNESYKHATSLVA
ncbi:serine/threonine-protein phosphatase regulatory ankyrin repeat [Salix suchowensis]|nr:serine/threonine-protein phosphatase regulatory ankyrin repeat [Salix suchowensis]